MLLIMRIPTIRGVIARRLLINYRVDPAVIAPLLPFPFRPQLVDGAAIAGICLIRLECVRPMLVPGFLGLSSENAAHRIAVEWDDHGRPRTGVYIPRRDTGSRFNALVGGRLFPGVHHHTRFTCEERDGNYRIIADADDGGMRLAVHAVRSDRFPSTSVFPDLETASQFFSTGSLGWSPGRTADTCDGLELSCEQWRVEPLQMTSLESSFFSDENIFPDGSASFDCALLMRDIRHQWHSRGRLKVGHVMESRAVSGHAGAPP